MTVICGGGSSTTKPGVASSVVVDRAYVQSLLPTVLQWLYPYLPWMSALEIGDVAAFCATDPPAVPSLPSADQFFSFITGGPITDAQVVNQFLRDLAQAYLWRSLCQCGTGSPTAITPPSDPGNLPVVNPPSAVSPPLGEPCLTIDSGVVSGPGPFSGLFVWTDKVIPSTATFVVCTLTVFSENASGDVVGWGLYQRPTAGSNTGGSYVVSEAFDFPPNTTRTLSGAITHPTWFYCAQVSDTGPSTTLQFVAKFYCGGQTATTPVVPCCPPDPLLSARLDQIYAMVTILQRQLAPFAYILGAAHSGLTGQGSFSVPRLLGVKVELTTLPGSYGEAVGSPTVIFDAGWVSILTADGLIDQRRIQATDTVWTPRLMSEAGTLGYSFSPGVVARITELEAEP